MREEDIRKVNKEYGTLSGDEKTAVTYLFLIDLLLCKEGEGPEVLLETCEVLLGCIEDLQDEKKITVDEALKLVQGIGYVHEKLGVAWEEEGQEVKQLWREFRKNVQSAPSSKKKRK